MLQGNVDESLQLGEGDNVAKACGHLTSIEAENRAVEIDIVSAGQIRVKARAQLQQAGDATEGFNVPARRFQDARDELEQGALSRSVLADERQSLAGLYLKRDVLERPELGAVAVVGSPERAQHQLLQRARSVVAQLELFRYTADRDGGHHSSSPRVERRR